MNIMEFKCYKDFLRWHIQNSQRRGVIAEMAAIAGCKRSYIHQVLSGKPELTPDQGWALTKYFGFSEAEAEYFFTLILYSRAHSQILKERLESKLNKIRDIR